VAAQTARGIDVTVWLDTNPQVVRVRHGGGWQRYTLWLENDPLHVLQMGNYFGTCLSVAGGCNAFSTIANAVELNKRVLYLRDTTGTIVGRKLLGLTAEGCLLGFHTYCSVQNDSLRNTLCAAIDHYCRSLAKRCHTPLADDGVVPTLFAEDWYDDGAVGWDDTDPPTPALSLALSFKNHGRYNKGQ